MPVPVLQAQGALAAISTNADLTVTIPAGEAVNDILVATLVAWVPNTSTGTATIAAPSGWTKFTPATTTITGGLIDAEYAFFWRRATSTAETNPTFTRPANWAISNWSGRVYIIRGCVTTGDPWTQLVASTISTAANPSIPAVNVRNTTNEEELDLPIAFIVKTDNTLTPTAQDGIGGTTWGAQTEVNTTTGTDAAMRAYTISFYSGIGTISAAAMTGGVAPAQGGAVYFVASFKAPFQRTAITDGGRGGMVSGFNPIVTSSAFYPITTNQIGMSFIGDGGTLSAASFSLWRSVVGANGTANAVLYAHTGTYGTTGTGTGSPLATSNPINISTITNTVPTAINTTFTFPDSDKYVLANGTPYVIVVSYTSGGTDGLAMRRIEGTQFPSNYYSGNGVNKVPAFWENIDQVEFAFSVEKVSAVGNIVSTGVVQRTASGSGAGTETTLGSIPKVGINWAKWGIDALIQ